MRGDRYDSYELMALKEHGTFAMETEMSFKKKGVASRNWIALDNNGQGIILDLDKYDIMKRVEINARDLRIIDPLLSYPSAILGRSNAIVLNLEHIKAIITTDEVLLRDPLDDDVMAVVEELQRRLPLAIGRGEGEEEGFEVGTSEQTAGVEEEFPFEFRALEVALEGVCSSLDAQTRELEVDAYPALDDLTAKAYFMQVESTMNKLTTLREYIDDTEDYINIQLDNHRNQLIQLELFLSSGTVCLSMYSLVAAIFGMNIPYPWRESHGHLFKWVILLTTLASASIFLWIISYARHKGLAGS